MVGMHIITRQEDIKVMSYGRNIFIHHQIRRHKGNVIWWEYIHYHKTGRHKGNVMWLEYIQHYKIGRHKGNVKW
jgi:hypothetical protein